MPCKNEDCPEMALFRVYGMIGGEPGPHLYCVEHGKKYADISSVLGVGFRIEPLTAEEITREAFELAKRQNTVRGLGG